MRLGIRVAIVDDHRSFATSLRLALGHYAKDLEIVGEAHSCERARRLISESRPEVVLMDIYMPDGDGIELTGEVKKALPDVKVLILTGSEVARDVSRAMEAGVHGYLIKDFDVDRVIEAVRTAQAGGLVFAPLVADILAAWVEGKAARPLSDDEARILELIAEGMENPQIATEMAMSMTTVKRCVRSALGKLGARTRAHATAIAAKRGLI
ncbi:MAG: response regulator [Actinomycetota bacterium]